MALKNVSVSPLFKDISIVHESGTCRWVGTDIELYFCYREEKGCWAINGVNEKGLNYQNTRLRLVLRLFFSQVLEVDSTFSTVGFSKMSIC